MLLNLIFGINDLISVTYMCVLVCLMGSTGAQLYPPLRAHNTNAPCTNNSFTFFKAANVMICRATVTKLLLESGWNYLGCPRCRKKPLVRMLICGAPNVKFTLPSQLQGIWQFCFFPFCFCFTISWLTNCKHSNTRNCCKDSWLGLRWKTPLVQPCSSP